MKKTKKSRRAYMCIGTHGLPYVTYSSSHYACNGRYEIYENKQDALNNSLGAKFVIPIRILYKKVS